MGTWCSFSFETQNRSNRRIPGFYDITFGDIEGIRVTHRDDTQTFIKSETGWVFADSGEPVDNDRWGGVPLLLTGPRSSRVLEEVVQDPASFGLDPPLTHIVITLRSEREIDLFIGDKTPGRRFQLCNGGRLPNPVHRSWRLDRYIDQVSNRTTPHK